MGSYGSLRFETLLRVPGTVRIRKGTDGDDVVEVEYRRKVRCENGPNKVRVSTRGKGSVRREGGNGLIKDT